MAAVVLRFDLNCVCDFIRVRYSCSDDGLKSRFWSVVLAP